MTAKGLEPNLSAILGSSPSAKNQSEQQQQQNNNIVLKSIDAEMTESHTKFQQIEAKILDEIIGNRIKKLSLHKIGQGGASDEDMEKLEAEIRNVEADLAAAVETVNSSVRRTQNTADMEIANADKELKKLLS